mgnify:FL=1|jgi:hypothetical protein
MESPRQLWGSNAYAVIKVEAGNPFYTLDPVVPIGLGKQIAYQPVD